MGNEFLISYYIGAFVWAIIWGVVARAVVVNKGYKEKATKYFWLGFFFSFIPVIVAATKPNVNTPVYQSNQTGAMPNDNTGRMADMNNQISESSSDVSVKGIAADDLYSQSDNNSDDSFGKTVSPGFENGTAKRPVVITTGRQTTKNKTYLDSRTVFVGRKPECSIIYKDGTPGVSGKHCSITWDSKNKEFIVVDLDSSYGTYLVSGLRLEPNLIYRLHAGDEIYIGEQSNTLRLDLE